VKFFIPGAQDNPAAAEERWQLFLAKTPATAASRRVYAVTYEHGGARYEATVGQRRRRYARQTGPRGGHLKDAGYASRGEATGTEIAGIIDDGGDVLYVWSFGPPFDGWANPSLVGRSEVRSLEYFDLLGDIGEAAARPGS
jgi:hypothetical protein